MYASPSATKIPVFVIPNVLKSIGGIAKLNFSNIKSEDWMLNELSNKFKNKIAPTDDKTNAIVLTNMIWNK